eukprot:GGOE01007713.1.p1 GENE.GGOE01007713.1~~GGOE01007713.1.p1  ORF type:complete len:803 (-),score=177.88 GGOE01007713.1:428-2815(-)
MCENESWALNSPSWRSPSPVAPVSQRRLSSSFGFSPEVPRQPSPGPEVGMVPLRFSETPPKSPSLLGSSGFGQLSPVSSLSSSSNSLRVHSPGKSIPVESMFRNCFGSIQVLFEGFDEDRCGMVPFPQMRAHLERRGLLNSRKLTTLFQTNIDKDGNNKVDLGEFLVIVFFWKFHGLGSYRLLCQHDLERASNIKVGMDELYKLFRSHTKGTTGRLSKTEALQLFQEALPRVQPTHLNHWFSSGHFDLSFSQYLKLLFVSLDGKLPKEGLHSQHGLWNSLVHLYDVLEADYQWLGKGNPVTLTDLMRPTEHVLQAVQPGRSPDGRTYICDICGGGAHYVCPHPGCFYALCQNCGSNRRSHTPAFAAVGKHQIISCIRAIFQQSDSDSSGRLDFFQFTWFVYRCCETISYSAVCPSSTGAACVKATMMEVHRQFRQYDVNQSAHLSWDEASHFCRSSLGSLPSNAQSCFSLLADRQNGLAMPQFFTFLYLLVRPSGKFANRPLKGPNRVSAPSFSVVGPSGAKPGLPVFRQVDVGRIQWDKQVGQGGQSTVYLVTYEKYRLVARKPLAHTSQTALQDTINGARIQMRVRHKNIASVVGIHTTPPVCILMEYCEGGDVCSLWKDALTNNPILPPLQWQLAHELAEALFALHTSRPPIVHRDVKGSNVFLDGELHVLLADFDLATPAPVKGMCGTPGYMAPEVLNDAEFGCPADVFAYGSFLYEVTHGRFPWSDEVPMAHFHDDVREKTLKGATPRLGSNVPFLMQQLMRQCWSPRPQDRPSMAQVLAALDSMRSDFR